MRIVFPPSMLSDVRDAAYCVREHLHEHHSALPSKAAWLSLWAAAMGYRDWNELQHLTKTAHATAPERPLFDPDDLPRFAAKLATASGLFGMGEALWLATLAASMSSRLVTGVGGLAAALCDRLDGPIKLVLGPSSPEQYAAFMVLMPFCSMSFDRAIEAVCEKAKAARKGAEPGDLALARIHLKKGITAQACIEGLIKSELIAIDGDKIRPTGEGQWWWQNERTDEFGEAWQAWWPAVASQVPVIWLGGFTDAERALLIQMFASGCTPEQAARFVTPTPEQLASVAELEAQIEARCPGELARRPMAKIVMLEPTLLLGRHDSGLRDQQISATVSGPEWAMPPGEITMKALFPNRCYRHAVLKSSGRGWFALPPEGVDRFMLEVTYTLPGRDGSPRTLTHQMHISLEGHDDPVRRLYGMRLQGSMDCAMIESPEWLFSDGRGQPLTREEVAASERGRRMLDCDIGAGKKGRLVERMPLRPFNVTDIYSVLLRA